MIGEEVLAIAKRFTRRLFGKLDQKKVDAPSNKGVAGQVLITDGNGQTKWGTVSEVTNRVVNDDKSVSLVFPDEEGK